jgi:hypothetical protein
MPLTPFTTLCKTRLWRLPLFHGEGCMSCLRHMNRVLFIVLRVGVVVWFLAPVPVYKYDRSMVFMLGETAFKREDCSSISLNHG